MSKVINDETSNLIILNQYIKDLSYENFKKNEVVVALLHDSGSRYIGKIYNDDWMKKLGFL